MRETGGNLDSARGAPVGDVPALIAAAHELKGPLALVRQLSFALEDETLSPSERARLSTQIRLTSERALRLTGDLTKLSRLDDALFSLEPINPYELCRDIVFELEPLFEAMGRRLELMPRRHPLLLVANRDLLRRIVMNFSDNALHYGGANGAVRIQIQALNNGKTIRLGVRDYGPAVSTKVWKEISSRLARSPQPVASRPQSSGLGLYIAAQFADAMQGNLGCIRHKDGATFYVDLQASRQLSFL